MATLSETLRQRIAEAEGEAADLADRLRTIAEEKRAVLAAPAVDAKLLQKLEAEEQRIPGAIENLQTRAALLTTQIEGALQIEATERVKEIQSELTAVVLRINERRATGEALVAQLVQLFAEDYPDREQQQTLQSESRFLHEHYGVAYAQAPASHALNAKHLLPVEEVLRKAQRLATSRSAWDEKTEAILTQRHAAAQRETDAHRREQAARLTVR